MYRKFHGNWFSGSGVKAETQFRIYNIRSQNMNKVFLIIGLTKIIGTVKIAVISISASTRNGPVRSMALIYESKRILNRP